ncbi:hypothetical protein EV13_2605 [Prochlorococcus sp. MIT 0702]|nr:hypothetical protein EV12_2393 [Prochlorococcus sp. MIT 0701]KGG26470.1 hypothetical protein EV13_2605 [Prochlorococcus sp. MIT 0702]KGG31108.1 hypothetical protein EV14_2478 [Prochlorococcus sp. MIT 0703]
MIGRATFCNAEYIATSLLVSDRIDRINLFNACLEYLNDLTVALEPCY